MEPNITTTKKLILGTSIVNSWILYNNFFLQQGKQIPILNFKESFMLSLVTGTPETNLKPGPSSSEVSGIRSSHTLVEVDGPKTKKRKRCRGCYEQISNQKVLRWLDQKQEG